MFFSTKAYKNALKSLKEIRAYLLISRNNQTSMKVRYKVKLGIKREDIKSDEFIRSVASYLKTNMMINEVSYDLGQYKFPMIRFGFIEIAKPEKNKMRISEQDKIDDLFRSLRYMNECYLSFEIASPPSIAGFLFDDPDEFTDELNELDEFVIVDFYIPIVYTRETMNDILKKVILEAIHSYMNPVNEVKNDNILTS